MLLAMPIREPVMSEITNAVQRRWAGELTSQEIAAEAARLEKEAIRQEQAIAEEMLRRWEQENPDRPRDEAPVTLFEQQARPLAIETLLAQVWEGYRDPDDGPDQETELQELKTNERIRRATPAMSRWLTDRASEPSRPTEQLVAQVWPTQPPAMIVALELLVQARVEDELPVPTAPADPLADQLLELTRQGLRERDERIAAALDENE